MADGKGGKKLQWKKSEKSRRLRRKELWAKEEKEIKELEARCREVSSLFFTRGSTWVLMYSVSVHISDSFLVHRFQKQVFPCTGKIFSQKRVSVNTN